MKEKIQNLINEALDELKLSEFKSSFTVEHPGRIDFGDYSSNVGIISKKSDEILKLLKKRLPSEIREVDVKVGFINFHLSKVFFRRSLGEILEKGDRYGAGRILKNKKVIIEYTDPNPFKEFHIGHLMSNSIGEAISRLIEWSGAEVRRASYQGDVGLHVAYPVAHKLKSGTEWKTIKDVARSYSEGVKLAEVDSEFKKYVQEINRKIYGKSDGDVHSVYDLGKKISFSRFEEIYKILGTAFDFYFFESASAEFGAKLTQDNSRFFEQSEGAIVFRGEKYDPTLHTRVFLTKEHIPTYEAKELGLAKIKYDLYPYDISVVITASEINDYFRVVLKAMSLIFPDLAPKTVHVSHGVMRLPTGKMSSRTGEVISARDLIDEAEGKVKSKIDISDREIADKEKLVEEVAVAAIKYSILKQSIGKDIIFDFDKSLSFEGDSGPYLQYTHARANSILEKAREVGITYDQESTIDSKQEIFEAERLLYRFPEVIERAAREYAPNFLVTYLVELAGSFNSFYGKEQIVNVGDANSSHKIAITSAVKVVLENGLDILGIKAPERM